MPNFLGIEIGGTKLQLLITDEHLTERESFRFSVDKASGAEAIRSAIAEVIEKTRPLQIKRIGVGFGGPINKTTGKIFTSYHVEGWSDFSIKDWLEPFAKCEVIVENDANVAALGEALHGAGANYRTVFYVTLGSGVGAGLVVDKNIYHGAAAGETEFGHLRLNKEGLTVQDSCSGWAVNEKIKSAIKNNHSPILSSLSTNFPGNESAALAEALNQKDKVAIGIFEDTVDDLAFGLSHVIHLLNPDTIIIGGGLSLMGEVLKTGIESRIKKYLMDALHPGPKIQLATLKEKVVPIGAISLAIKGNTL
jgi:glucokinase